MFHLKLGWVVGLIGLSFVGNAFAVPNSQYLTFNEAASLALAESPDLKALRYQEEASRIRSGQALAPNNPVLTYSEVESVGGNPFGGNFLNSAWGVSWTLGFPGKAWALRAALKHQAASTSLQARAKEIEILAALSNNYIALAVNSKTREVLGAEQRKAEDLLKLIEKRYVAGQGAQVDLLNGRVVLANFNQSLLQNTNDRKILLTTFRNLIKRPVAIEMEPQTPSEIIIPTVDSTSEKLVEIMLKNRPALKSAEETVAASESALTTTQLSPLPDIQLGASKNLFHVNGASNWGNIPSDYTFSVGIAVPIFFPFNELQGMHAAARDREVAQAQADSQRLSALSDLQTILTHLETARSELKNLTELVVPAAKANYDLVLLTYSVGKSDYFRLNDARSTWVQSQKDWLAKRVDLSQTFNQLTQQLGCDLTQKEGPYVCR